MSLANQIHDHFDVFRSVLPNHQTGNRESHCEYCQPKICEDEVEEEEHDFGKSRFVYCYVEKDRETGMFRWSRQSIHDLGVSGPQKCAKSYTYLRQLMVRDPNQHAGCQLSKKSSFFSICWCRLQTNNDGRKRLVEEVLSNIFNYFSLKTPKDSQVHEINRIRFNSGHRGGLQVVRLQSAEDPNGRPEPLMKRARIVETSSLINSSSVQTSDQDQQGPIAASKPIAQKPVIHTVPRRPSPANNFAARWNLIGLILAVTVSVIF